MRMNPAFSQKRYFNLHFLIISVRQQFISRLNTGPASTGHPALYKTYLPEIEDFS
jgi:hypothetical protein